MATKSDKKSIIRSEIITAAYVYSSQLTGRRFLYVYDNEYFEVFFPKESFLHLTGVETSLSAINFYKNARKGQLTNEQFYFSARHSYANARKKLPCLQRLPELTTTMVCILKEMQTASIIYKLSLSNLEFTLGLRETEHTGLYIPMSLRVEDSSVAKSNGGEIVDFIFQKISGTAVYTDLLFRDERKEIPECIFPLLSDSVSQFREN